jgi:hypothetical protein
MKRLLFSLTVGLLLFGSSCKQVSSQQYNDTVVNMYSSYTTKLSSGLTVLGSTTADAAKKQAAAEQIDRLTDSCTKVMNELKPVEEAKDFHTKMLQVYQAVKTDLVPLGRRIAAIPKPEDNVDAYNKLAEELDATSEKLDALETETQNAQAAFAAKVNMRVK